MRTLFVLLATSLILATGVTTQATPPPKHVEDKPLDVPVPRGAVHIVVTAGDSDIRKEFTYFPYPLLPTNLRIIAPNASGLYRVEVSPEGNVTAVTILKTLGKRLDGLVLRTFITWKAKPGPLRCVDINWFYRPALPASRRGGGIH
ncbi:MAG TPA: hypothetical protein VGQ95_12245 [Chthoniobacterales bacterium]|nr:hypothetical protein [Chthoniobacterales bacterium]